MSYAKPYLVTGLFERNKRDLFGYLARRVGREDAADLLQETFVRLLRHDRFETIADPAAFLKQIAINLTRDFARRRKIEACYLEFRDLPEAPADEDARPDGRLEADDESRLLRDALDALPPRQREVLALHLHENLSLAEIADRLEISDRMVRKHLGLALRACRSMLRASTD